MEFPNKATMFDTMDKNKNLKIDNNKIVLSKIKKGEVFICLSKS